MASDEFRLASACSGKSGGGPVSPHSSIGNPQLQIGNPSPISGTIVAPCPARPAMTPGGRSSSATASAARFAATAGARRRAARALDEARIPRRYEHCDLDNFVTYPNEKLQNVVAQRAPVCRCVPGRRQGAVPDRPARHRQEPSGRRGPEGGHCGRAARAGLFYDVRELLKMIRSTYNPVVKTTETEVLRPVMQTDLLVLDDIGAEKTSEWVEETLNLIVNTRYNERRLTIFTSNYEEKEDRTRPRLAAGPRRLPDALAALRDVRVPRVRRRRLPPRAAQRHRRGPAAMWATGRSRPRRASAPLGPPGPRPAAQARRRRRLARRQGGDRAWTVNGTENGELRTENEESRTETVN